MDHCEIFLNAVENRNSVNDKNWNKLRTRAAFITGKVFQPILVTTVFQVSSDFRSPPTIIQRWWLHHYIKVSIDHESYVGSNLVLNLIMWLNMCEINADFHCCLATFWFLWYEDNWSSLFFPCLPWILFIASYFCLVNPIRGPYWCDWLACEKVLAVQ